MIVKSIKDNFYIDFIEGSNSKTIPKDALIYWPVTY
jgi:hypothetical protein